MADKTPDFLTISDEHIDIALRVGTDIEGVRVKTLRMREPSVKDQLAQDKYKGTDGEKEIFMFANLCSVAPADLEALKLRDYLRVQAAFKNFID